jgi:hypothetical protein
MRKQQREPPHWNSRENGRTTEVHDISPWMCEVWTESRGRDLQSGIVLYVLLIGPIRIPGFPPGDRATSSSSGMHLLRI